jgi:hypothetical protein
MAWLDLWFSQGFGGWVVADDEGSYVGAGGFTLGGSAGVTFEAFAPAPAPLPDPRVDGVPEIPRGGGAGGSGIPVFVPRSALLSLSAIRQARANRQKRQALAALLLIDD